MVKGPSISKNKIYLFWRHVMVTLESHLLNKFCGFGKFFTCHLQDHRIHVIFLLESMKMASEVRKGIPEYLKQWNNTVSEERMFKPEEISATCSSPCPCLNPRLEGFCNSWIWSNLGNKQTRGQSETWASSGPQHVCRARCKTTWEAKLVHLNYSRFWGEIQDNKLRGFHNIVCLQFFLLIIF